jgi:hypothetical protein
MLCVEMCNLLVPLEKIHNKTTSVILCSRNTEEHGIGELNARYQHKSQISNTLIFLSEKEETGRVASTNPSDYAVLLPQAR